jgi:uncharacterized membrane protein YfcA
MSELLPGLQLTAFQLALAIAVVFAAAIVRGFSGFGFSMLTVTSLSLLRPPAEVVPMVLMLEVAASLRLLPMVWRDADWRSLRWLLAGTALATPVGVAVLASVRADSMRVVVSVFVMLAVVFLWRGFTLRRVPGARATFATGLVAGLLNGSAAIAGPPTILFYFSSPAGVAVSRASLIAYFLGTDLIGVALASAYGLVNRAILLRAGAFLLPLVLGVSVGHRHFVRTNPESFRRLVLALLLVLSLAGLLRAMRG